METDPFEMANYYGVAIINSQSCDYSSETRAYSNPSGSTRQVERSSARESRNVNSIELQYSFQKFIGIIGTSGVGQ